MTQYSPVMRTSMNLDIINELKMKRITTDNSTEKQHPTGGKAAAPPKHQSRNCGNFWPTSKQ